ncbi:MAG TPA: response regulator [Thermodesulfovibrio thiophilus]|uniref:response regulator n=1 Tax=Thermodesulfovibrio thiophilus TaxID=340095 RepID=UPI00041D2C32|nr:response regulator [Thermodesulfovibrio thiophilus]HQD35729.1 response regulator [Thermodesulfovibrio thiophilus]
MPKRAIVIEDNELVAETLKTMLEFFNFEVVVFDNGIRAIEEFISQMKLNTSFDIVFVDLVLPGMSGKEVMQKLKEINPEIKAIVSSGYSNDPSIAMYENAGFKGMLNKPYTLQELEDVLKQLSLI